MKAIENTLRSFGRIAPVDLGKRSVFRIGTQAVCFFPEDEESLAGAYAVLREEGAIPVGGTSNTLFSSDEIASPLVMFTDMRGPGIERFEAGVLSVKAGVTVQQLLSYCMENGLSGLEFIVGMPATVGGLVAMNAGFKGESMERVTREVFRCGEMILEARLTVTPADKAQVRETIRKNIEYRKAHQEWGVPTLGCVFRNPDHELSAGAMIDQCGLKGLMRNGARISHKHANFIVNDGGAVSDDVIYLIETMREKVRNRFGVELEEEIVRVGC